MSKIKFVKKHDYRRIFLTELFPYEVPLVFNVEGWKDFCSKHINKFENISNKYYIPFNYDIKKGTDEFRTLSLIHPLQCNEFSEFYKKYGTQIVYTCNKQTKVSLRYPAKITNMYYSETARHKEYETVEIDEPEEELVEYIKFFSYRKFDGVYKFFESAEYQRLEKKYLHCFICDISKCFYNIYTHTISWAIKTQEIAKENIKVNSFDSNFDQLMQRSNYNETHGIVVGPEISRIFAEIILQKIDDNIIKELQGDNYVFDRDYTIRRYVDDYYIYYNDESIFHIIYTTLQKCLLEYKLTINESKSQYLKNPFITNNTMAKVSLSSLLSERLEKSKLKDLSYNDAIKIITQIKTIVNNYGIPYSSVVNYLLAAFDKIISNAIKEIHAGSIKSSNIYTLLESLFSIYFFLYNMDIRVDTSYKLSRRILATVKGLTDKENVIDNFLQFVIKELERCFDRIKNIGTRKNVSIESINYIYTLLALQDFCKKRYIKVNIKYYFDKLFFDDDSCFSIEYFSSFNYFELMGFIHCYNDHADKMEVFKKYLIEYFKEKTIARDAESFYIFIDVQCCFYSCFDKNFKMKIFDEVIENGFKKNYSGSFDQFSNDILETKCSFTEWEINWENVLNRLLTKKAKFNYDR
jgi:hypothetical protein